MGNSSNVVSTLRKEVGEQLRVVGEYDDEGYDLLYVRDDIRPAVEELDLERIHRELVLQGIGREHLEDLYEGGRLQCSVHRFDELTACHFVESETTGRYVSIDSDATVDFETFVETCRWNL